LSIQNRARTAKAQEKLWDRHLIHTANLDIKSSYHPRSISWTKKS